MVFFLFAAFLDPPPELFFAAGRAAGRLALRLAGAARRAELFFALAPPFFAAALRAGAFFVEAEDFFDDFFDEAFEADFFADDFFADDFFEDLDDLAELFAEDFFALFFAAICVSPVQKFRMGSRTF